MHLAVNPETLALTLFQYNAPTEACGYCTSDFKSSAVSKTQDDVQWTIDGLCLDCIDTSPTKTGDLDSDYWEHDRLKLCDAGCKISHEQPTWYFSFMSRREETDTHKKAQRARRYAPPHGETAGTSGSE